MAASSGFEAAGPKKSHSEPNKHPRNEAHCNLKAEATPIKIPYWKQFRDSFKPAPSQNDRGNSDFHPKKGQDTEPVDGLKRTLNNRHIQMIAFGGAIGTGLFIGSGRVLSTGGPASVLIGFILIGTMLFNVVMALAELAVVFPVAGSFVTYSSRFIDPAWGFAMGWNYTLGMLMMLPTELSAAAITIRYWNMELNIGIWIAVFWATVAVINLFGVRGYGEAEFVFSMVKIIAILGFIVLGVVVDCGGAPKGGYLGAKTWTDPGAFHNGFKGFCSVLVTAAFAFGGTEMVGLAAAESEDPRKTLPVATKQVFWRISIFYIVSLFLVGLIVPYNHPQLLGNSNDSSANTLLTSPFVIAIQEAGINVLPSIFNGVILVSILSVANATVYGASRLLCALASQGQAPRCFGYVDRQGRPIVSIALALALGWIAFIGELDAEASDMVFDWLMAISGLATFFTWTSICWSHIMFRRAWRAQGHGLEELPFEAVFGEAGSWYGIVLNVSVLVVQLFIAIWPTDYETMDDTMRTATFFKAYLAAVVIMAFYVFWKLYKRTLFMVPVKGGTGKFFLLNTETIDLLSGRSEMNLASVLESERREKATWPVWKRLYRGLCG